MNGYGHCENTADAAETLRAKPKTAGWAGWRKSKFASRNDVRCLVLTTSTLLALTLAALIWMLLMHLVGLLTHGRYGSAVGFWSPVSSHFSDGAGVRFLPTCCDSQKLDNCIPCANISLSTASAACPVGFKVGSTRRRCALDTGDAALLHTADELGREVQYMLR